MLRIAVDATALHGHRTGVGVFTTELLARLAARPDLDVSAYSVSWRGRGDLPRLVPAGIRTTHRPMAARPLRAAWARSDHPVIERFVGPIDVVHGTNFVVPPTRRAAQVVTVHDLTPWRFPDFTTADTRAYPGLLARAVRRRAWIHAVSEFVAGELRERLPEAAERIVCVPNGVTPLADGPQTTAEHGRTRAGAERYVLAVGTVEPRKDLPGLVAAFDAIAGDHPTLRLVLAGADGWGAEALAVAIARARHPDQVVRLGWVSDDDRAALVRGATVFAYPSRYEGFGLPPLEAMSAGVPVLTTTAGALPEVVGDAAELVPPDDRVALVAALDRLLTDEHRRAELVAAGHRRIDRWSWAHTAEGLAALYARAATHRDRQ